ncbi:MAG: PAS domain S-box protein [Microcoleus anatoxicus]|uniref:PAS domain S-box protein n=1 Tax=Microcoleus anatoxicus TaxID=2705319 RepID=UPI00366CC5E4
MKNSQYIDLDAKERFLTLSLEMLCVIGFDGYFKLIDPTTTKILGYSEAELLAKPFIEFVHPEEREATFKKVESIAASNCTIDFENRHCCKDGSYKWISWTISPALEDELMYAVGRDISGCKPIEISLLESILESTADLIFVKDTQGRYVSLNSKTAAFFGKSKAEVIGKKDTDFFSPEIVAKLVEIDRRVIQSGLEETVEEVVEDLDGNLQTYLATKSPWRDREGNIIGVVGVTRDISDRKIAEEQLRQKEEFLRSIYDSVDYSIFVIDVGADGEFRYAGWNQAAELLGNISSEFGCGKTPEEIFPVPAAAFLRQKLTECLRKNSSISYEEAVSFDTIEVWFLITLNPLRDESGKIFRIVGSATEITYRKKAEQALAEQLKLSVFRADVGIALTDNQILPVILQKCCDAVVRHLDAAFARIWTLNEDENVLELEASAGMYTHINGDHSHIPVGQFKIGLIAKERKPHLTNAVMEDPRVSNKEWAEREGMVAFAGYPLIVDNQLVGVIAMFSRHELNELTLIALASIADAIALGIKRKQIEVALAKQKQTLRGIIDNAPIWVWMTNINGRMLLVNKTFCEDVAIPEDKFLAATHYSEVLGVEASANYMASDLQAWSQDTPSYSEEVMQLADGEEHYLETIKTQIKDASGNSIGLIGLGLDVTQEKESQRKLQESEARFRKLAEQEALLNQLASNIRASLDLDTILATTVEQIRELLQVDRCLFMWYLPDASPPAWDVVYEAKNDDLLSLLGYYPADVTGSLPRTIANLEVYEVDNVETLSDAVERDFFLQAGYKSFLDLPIKSAGGLTGVVSCVSCREVHRWTKNEVELIEAIGNQLAIAISQSELYTQSVDSARIAQEQAKQLEVTLCELQQAQTQLVQAEKMSSLGQMVAGIAHEINNPVSFIFGNISYIDEYTRSFIKLLEMYRDEFPEAPPAIKSEIDALELDFLLDDLPKILSSMKVGAIRIRDIVRSLRSFSRLDESAMKSVNLHEGIDSTLMILEHRLKAQSVSVAGTEYHRPLIQVVKEYGELPLVECYAGQLNQVFMNIIANAIDAVEEQKSNPGIIRLRTEVEGNFVAIAISDNGVGMTDRVKQRIFDPFYTTKAIGSGTGMGLAISHSIIVEKHQGEINCISALGKGTEFIIKIPIVSH